MRCIISNFSLTILQIDGFRFWFKENDVDLSRIVFDVNIALRISLWFYSLLSQIPATVAAMRAVKQLDLPINVNFTMVQELEHAILCAELSPFSITFDVGRVLLVHQFSTYR